MISILTATCIGLVSSLAQNPGTFNQFRAGGHFASPQQRSNFHPNPAFQGTEPTFRPPLDFHALRQFEDHQPFPLFAHKSRGNPHMFPHRGIGNSNFFGPSGYGSLPFQAMTRSLPEYQESSPGSAGPVERFDTQRVLGSILSEGGRKRVYQSGPPETQMRSLDNPQRKDFTALAQRSLAPAGESQESTGADEMPSEKAAEGSDEPAEMYRNYEEPQEMSDANMRNLFGPESGALGRAQAQSKASAKYGGYGGDPWGFEASGLYGRYY